MNIFSSKSMGVRKWFFIATTGIAIVSAGISLYFWLQAARLSKIQMNGYVVTSIPRIDTSPALKPLSDTKQQDSKLGIFILSSYSYGSKEVVGAMPRVIKVMDPHVSSSLAEAIMEYNAINPEGIVVVRISKRIEPFTLSDDPEESASLYMETVISPALSAMRVIHGEIDIIEAPNEVEQTPGWETLEEVTWNGMFWARLTELISKKGVRTCVGSFPVGNPGGTMEEITAKMKAFSPALEAALSTGSPLCYHGYSLQYTTDSGIENWFSLRHRILHASISEVHPKYATIPFLISEAGIDSTGDPSTSGWAARGSEEQYINWLSWYDTELQKDEYVLGATLFQIGDSYWSSFDNESIAWWLKRHLADTDR